MSDGGAADASGAYTLVAAGAVLAASGGLLVGLFERPLALFGAFAVVGVTLAAFGALELAGSAPGDAARGADPLVRGGSVGFWVLLAALLLDGAWSVVPADRRPVAYVAVGCLAALAAAASALVE